MIQKCYISHPIAGKSEDEKSADENHGTKWAAMMLNMDALLPRTIPPACGVTIDYESCGIPGRFLPGDAHTVQCYLRGDFLGLLGCDAILMMPGWQNSYGCMTELNVAAQTGIPIHFYGMSFAGVGAKR